MCWRYDLCQLTSRATATTTASTTTAVPDWHHWNLSELYDASPATSAAARNTTSSTTSATSTANWNTTTATADSTCAHSVAQTGRKHKACSDYQTSDYYPYEWSGSHQRPAECDRYLWCRV